MAEAHAELQQKHQKRLQQQGPTVWRTFSKQDQALDFALHCPVAGCRVYSYEVSAGGARRFLVANDFFYRYWRMQPRDR